MAEKKTFEELVEDEMNKSTEPEVEEGELAPIDLEEVEEEDVEDNEEIEDNPPDEKTYNKQEVENITKARVKNYNKRLDKMNKYKDALDTLADITGLESDSLADTLLNMTPAQQAKMLNIPLEQVSGAVSQRKQARMTKKEQTETKRKLKYLDLEKQDGYEHLSLLREDIEALLDTKPGLSYEEAYVLVSADMKPSKTQPKPAKKAKRVISDDQVSGNRTTSNRKVSSAVKRAAKAAGMEPGEYVAYANMGNIDDYYKYKNIKPKG